MAVEGSEDDRGEGGSISVEQSEDACSASMIDETAKDDFVTSQDSAQAGTTERAVSGRRDQIETQSDHVYQQGEAEGSYATAESSRKDAADCQEIHPLRASTNTLHAQQEQTLQEGGAEERKEVAKKPNDHIECREDTSEPRSTAHMQRTLDDRIHQGGEMEGSAEVECSKREDTTQQENDGESGPTASAIQVAHSGREDTAKYEHCHESDSNVGTMQTAHHSDDQIRSGPFRNDSPSSTPSGQSSQSPEVWLSRDNGANTDVSPNVNYGADQLKGELSPGATRILYQEATNRFKDTGRGLHQITSANAGVGSHSDTKEADDVVGLFDANSSLIGKVRLSGRGMDDIQLRQPVSEDDIVLGVAGRVVTFVA